MSIALVILLQLSVAQFPWQLTGPPDCFSSHWDSFAVLGGGYLVLYYCNVVNPDLDNQLASFSAMIPLVGSSGL